MNTLITILACTSLIVSFLPNFLNLLRVGLLVILLIFDPDNMPETTINIWFFIWLALLVWPIVYFNIS